MKILLPALFAFFFIQNISAQDSLDIYIDKFGGPCKEKEALYIRNIKKHEGDIYTIKDIHLDDSTLFQTGYVKIRYSNPLDTKTINTIMVTTRQHIKNGEFTRYFRNGNIDFKGTFADNQKKGPFKYWYENGNFKGEFIYSADEEIDHDFRVMSFYDTLNNQLVVEGTGSYYELSEGFQTRGEIDEGYKTGDWTGFFKNGNSTFSETYERGKLVEGESIDSLGVKYSYTEIVKSPEYYEGQSAFYKYLSNEIKYPRKAQRSGIEGRVYVGFIVNTEGDIEETKVVRGIDNECDQEALRVVENAGKFIPGQYRGQIAKIRLTLPVSFKLQ